MRTRTWQILLTLIVMGAVPVGAGLSEPTTPIKEQIVKLLASIMMTLNHAVDEKFCRQFFGSSHLPVGHSVVRSC